MQLRRCIVNTNKTSQFSFRVVEGINLMNNESIHNPVLLAKSQML